MEFKTLLTSAAIVALSAGFASAQDDATLSVDGEVIKTRADAPAFAENLDTVYSGWHFRSGETQVLQMDDFENPAFVFVDQGVELFDMVEGPKVRPVQAVMRMCLILLGCVQLCHGWKMVTWSLWKSWSMNVGRIAWVRSLGSIPVVK